MRATRTGLTLSMALLLCGPVALSGQSGQAASPEDFWPWALAEVGESGATVAAAGRANAGTPARWTRLRPVSGLQVYPEDAGWRADGRLGATDLRAVLGEDLLARLLERTGHDREAAPYLNGRWAREAGPPRARVLQIRVVDRPLAEVNDLDGDGRVDVVLVHRAGG